jgi:hypothetical protein
MATWTLAPTTQKTTKPKSTTPSKLSYIRNKTLEIKDKTSQNLETKSK